MWCHSKLLRSKEGIGRKRTRRETTVKKGSVASGHLCVCVCAERGREWMAARGMCSLNQESPGAKAE